MRKWLKFLLAVLLLPVCVGAGLALKRVLLASGAADTFWAAALGGAGSWLAIYLLLPKPMWVYVFGHELTHALWVWLMGGKVKKFKASAQGGHVIVTKSNFLIALAPYFCPLYAILVAAVFVTGQRFWSWQAYVPWFHLLLGATYAFHLTLTWYILKSNQTDITQEGYLFSAVVIFLGNVSVLLVAIPLLAAKVSVTDAFRWWWECTHEVIQAMSDFSAWGWPRP